MEMKELREVEVTVPVPSNTGIAGFLRTIEAILRKPRVQKIVIDARGSITFRHFVSEAEPTANFGVDFAGLRPMDIVRNGEVEEVAVKARDNAMAVVGRLMDIVVTRQMRPLAFIVGTQTRLWDWFFISGGKQPSTKSHFFGAELLVDESVPPETLLLCAGFGRDAALLDARLTLKVSIPVVEVR